MYWMYGMDGMHWMYGMHSLCELCTPVRQRIPRAVPTCPNLCRSHTLCVLRMLFSLCHRVVQSM